MNKHLILFIIFPATTVFLLFSDIAVYGAKPSGPSSSASSSPPSSASQAQHPSTRNTKKAKATRTQKTSRKPIEALGWCCQKGSVNKKKITKSECTKQRGTFISLSSDPGNSCGFCSKDGKITAVTTKNQKNKCKSSKGHFYTSSSLAKKNLVWCCTKNALQYTDKNSCKSVGQKYAQRKTQTFIQNCIAKTGYCTTNGRILSNITQKKCNRLKGAFFTKRLHAQRDLVSKKAQVGKKRGSLKPIGQKDMTKEPLTVAKTNQPKKPADRRLAIQENRPDTLRPLNPKSFPEAEIGIKDPLKPVPPRFQVGVDSSRLSLREIVKGDGTVSSTPNRGAGRKPNSPEIKIAPRFTFISNWVGTTRASLLVDTNFPVDEVHVEAIPEPGGPYTAHVTDTLSGAEFASGKGKLRLPGLSAATTYNYKMVARKGTSEGWHEGTFRTKRRIVKFIIESIRAIDDGDDTSDGDFSFSFCEVGKCEYSSSNPRMDFSHTIGTGETIAVNHYMTFSSVREDSIDIHLSVIENDTSYGSRGGSLHHKTQSFYFDWVDEVKNNTSLESKNIRWDINHNTGSNPFHVKIKGKMVISTAIN